MKENKIEKLILDLSTRWECSPQEVVDRLNSMNESEINKLINSMTKKFQWGGLAKPPIQPRFVAPAHLDPSIQQPAPSTSSSKLLTAMMRKEHRNEAQKLMEQASDLRSKQYTDFLKQQEINKSTHSNQNTNRIMKNGGFIDCLRDGGSVEKCKCGCDKIAKAQGGKGKLGKGIVPEVQPRGIEGWFWKPTEYPRVDDYDNFDGEFTGTRSSYYTNDGDLMQILTKKFPAGNTAKTELLIENPNTPLADSTMTITNRDGINRIKNMKRAKQFLPAFKKNF